MVRAVGIQMGVALTCIDDKSRHLITTNEDDDFVAIALQPIWVANEPGALVVHDKRKGNRVGNPGPNGESPDSGKWKLLLPNGVVYNGPTISASALDTASECLHKWALPRLDDHEKPKNRKAELGGERHDDLEAWLKYGKAPMVEGMAKVINHFPAPGQCESECYFGFLAGRRGHEIVFAGYIDARESVLNQDDWVVSFDEDGNEVLDMVTGPMNSTIRDLKTTGDFKWKKTAAQLRANIQACIYGLGEMLRVEAATNKACDAVILKWTYALLKEDKQGVGVIKRVETVCDVVQNGGSTPDEKIANGPGGGVLLTKEQAIVTVKQYLKLAETLIEAIASGAKAKDMPKNSQACSMYGGCPWKRPLVEGADPLCAAPVGSGFMSQMRQARASKGIETKSKTMALVDAGVVRVDSSRSLGARFGVRALGPKTTTTTSPASGEVKTTEKKMGLGARFAMKTPAATAATAATAVAVDAAKVAAAKPVTGTVVAAPAAAAKQPGLGERFGKKAAPVTTAAPAATAPVAAAPAVAAEVKTPKVEEKATANGMAATGAGAAPSAGSSLRDRLTKLVKPGQAAAVVAAINAAPTVVVGALAVGINPPDVAPEWTQEQQEAEAQRIAGKAKPAEVTVGAAGAGASEPAAVVAPRGRGRPKKTTLVDTGAGVAASDTTVEAGDELSSALQTLDALTMRLMASGHRREASFLLEAAGKMTQATQAAA